jgi:two-component system sensor histidine kinase KdpD
MADQEYKRPSPEALLKLTQQDEASKNRGKLTIYFGFAPGVGKTYAMLTDAIQHKHDGIDVVVGYVETHGRKETDALLEGLEVIPPLVIEYMGVKLKETNLKKVLERKPKLVLVDELAHTNAHGSHNSKRYMDIEEILNAGIDVYTTLNVQHIESLNDTISQITGIRIRETVPDTFIESAGEIKLIDLPPEELLKRLAEGKVYVKDMVGLAVNSFFRSGNLLALRQLALRIVADRVDERMRGYMHAHAIAGPWPAKEFILAAVFASPYAEKLVRSAFRLANEVNAEWIAFYAETEKHKKLSAQEIEWLNKAMDLAKRLGAGVVWIKADNVVQAIVDYAGNNNVTMIVMGKSRHFGLFPSISKKILTKTHLIDIYMIDAKIDTEKPKMAFRKPLITSSPKKYAWGILSVVAASLVALILRSHLSQINLLFLLLLPVIVSAIYIGRGPSFISAIISILVFDYLFVTPYYSFAISDTGYFFSYTIYMVIAIIISNLAYKLRNKIGLLKQSEAKNIAFYGLSRDLVTAANVEQVLTILVRHTTQIFRCNMAIFFPSNDKLVVKTKTTGFDVNEKVLAVSSWVLLNKQSAGHGTNTLPQERATYLPMMVEDNIIGVIGFLFEDPGQVITPENLVVMETIARLGAIAIERSKSA